MRRRDAYVECSACVVAGGRGLREPFCGAVVIAAWTCGGRLGCAGGMDGWRAEVVGVLALGAAGARVLERRGRVLLLVPFREGFIRPFVGGGVAEFDQCRMLL